jgi:hypothetical protein
MSTDSVGEKIFAKLQELVPVECRLPESYIKHMAGILTEEPPQT